MRIQLYSLDHVPSSLPIWQVMLDDLGRPPARRVGRVLGVSVRTVYRWNARGAAPRVACLALFWLTQLGRSAVHAQAANDAAVACGYVAALRRDVERLEGQLAYVRALGLSGAANDPLLGGR